MAASLKPVYLIAGTDRPKVRLAVGRLRGRFDVDAIEVLHAGEATAVDVSAACNALGLFGGDNRLVIAEGVETWKAAEVKVAAEYLKTPTPGTVLALVAHELKKDSPLAKAVAKSGDVLVYDAPRKRDLPTWVARQFEQLGTAADRDACRLLVDVVGDELELVRNEIDKLATWAGDEPVTTATVTALASAAAEVSVFEVSDAWGRRDTAAVLAAVESLLERSGGRELPRLVGLLANHVSRVRACQALAAEGIRPRDAASRLKLHPYAAEKAFGHAVNFSADELGEATVQLAALDHALKGGSRLGGELELERTLVQITTPVDAPGVAA